MKIRIYDGARVEFVSACNKTSVVRMLDEDGRPSGHPFKVQSKDLEVPRDQRKGELCRAQGLVLYHDSLVVAKKQASRVGLRPEVLDIVEDGEKLEKIRKVRQATAIRKAKQAKAWKTGRRAK